MKNPKLLFHAFGWGEEIQPDEQGVAREFLRDQRRWQVLLKACVDDVPVVWNALEHLTWLVRLTIESGIEAWQTNSLEEALRNDVLIPKDLVEVIRTGFAKVYLFELPEGVSCGGDVIVNYEFIPDEREAAIALNCLLVLDDLLGHRDARETALRLAREHPVSIERIRGHFQKLPQWLTDALEETKKGTPPSDSQRRSTLRTSHPVVSRVQLSDLERVSRERDLDLATPGGRFQACLFASLGRQTCRDLEAAYRQARLSSLFPAARRIISWDDVQAAATSQGPIRLALWRFALDFAQAHVARTLEVFPSYLYP